MAKKKAKKTSKPKTRRPGRPPSAGGPLDKVVGVAFTESGKAEVRRAAKLAGISLVAFIREAALQRAARFNKQQPG